MTLPPQRCLVFSLFQAAFADEDDTFVGSFSFSPVLEPAARTLARSVSGSDSDKNNI